MDNRPAQVIKRKFPTVPCILKFHLEKTVDGKTFASPHQTEAVVQTILRKTHKVTLADGTVVERGMIEAFLVIPERGNEVKKIQRNLDLEDSNSEKNYDPLTYQVLKNSEIELVPTTAYQRDVIRELLNQMKDGFADHAAEAMKRAGDVGSALNALTLRVAAMPGHEAMSATQKDVQAVRALAETSHTQIEGVIAAAMRTLDAREARLAERESALAARMASIEETLGALRTDVRTLHALSPAEQQVEAPVQASIADDALDEVKAEFPWQAKVDAYRSKVATMNIGAVRGEFGRLKLPPVPAHTKTLDEQKAMLVDAHKRQLAAKG
jgi:hypothetical protein